jgi:hypothetical protein
MLTLYEFLYLPLVARSKYIHQKCTFLLCRKESKEVYTILYYAEDFYVEIWFDSTRQELLRIRPFTKRCYLESYLEEVDLNQLAPYFD